MKQWGPCAQNICHIITVTYTVTYVTGQTLPLVTYFTHRLARRPSRYAKLVFSSTNGATDEYIVKLRSSLPGDLKSRVISLRADGVPSHELGQMGFRQNALPAYVRADYGRLLESEDSL